MTGRQTMGQTTGRRTKMTDNKPKIDGRTDETSERQTEKLTNMFRQTVKQTDKQMNGRTDRWQDFFHFRIQVLTWAFIYSTLLRLMIVRAAAFPTTKGRWVCTGTSAFSHASTTEFVTGRPKAPSTPPAIHYNRDNLLSPKLCIRNPPKGTNLFI